MAIIGKRVFIFRGAQRGAFGTVIYADSDSFCMLTDDNERIYDRFENIVRSEK